jgi:probable rRNA maturation factor
MSARRAPRIAVAVEDASGAAGVPAAAALRRAARATLLGARRRRAATLAIRIVGTREARAINRRWRRKDYAPNVLSFPAALPDAARRALAGAPLGDLVICAPVVAREARAQRKPAAAHWAHMVVHGVLHLIGHDHQRPREAARMERLERRVLASLGHPDPYLAER